MTDFDDEIERAFDTAAERKARVRERYPQARMVGFMTATSYLIQEDGVWWAVDLETLEREEA